jgi:hypothetical protein
MLYTFSPNQYFTIYYYVWKEIASIMFMISFEYPKAVTSTNRVNEPRQKVYVNVVEVSILISRELYFDNDGKPITTS